MIIYEVNLTINNEIFDNYYKWLIEHIEIMLQFDGFKKAEIARELSPIDSKQTKLTVNYTVETEDYLNHYLTNHATAMREDGVKKFGNNFSASRRIFTNLSILLRG